MAIKIHLACMNRNQIDKIDHNCSERAISSCRMKNPHFKKASVVHICTTGWNRSFQVIIARKEIIIFKITIDITGTETAGGRCLRLILIQSLPVPASEQVRISVNSRFRRRRPDYKDLVRRLGVSCKASGVLRWIPVVQWL